MHAMISSAKGKKETRCGKTVEQNQATSWESDVTCPECKQPKK
jgi:hypothetical protein